MDNIAQSMRFSPAARVIYRNLNPEVVFAVNRSLLTTAKVTQAALRRIYRTALPHSITKSIAAIARLGMTRLNLRQLVVPF